MKWDLTYFFKTEEEFEKELDSLKTFLPKVASYKGLLSSEEKFKEYILLSRELEKRLLTVFQYAHLRSDLDKRNVKNNNDYMKVMTFLNQLNEETSWVDPEIITIGKEKIISFINNHKELEEYRFQMEKLFRMNEHILDATSEKLLSLYGPLRNRGGDLYSAFAVADNKDTTIKISDGSKVTVTQGNWRALITKVPTAKDRQKVFEAIFNKFEESKNTYAEFYNTTMLTENANAKARNYKSILESHLFYNNIPTSVFLNIVDVAGKNTKSLKKYIKLRQKYLGLKHHFTYDRFLELAHSNKEYEYEEAKKIFFDSLAGLPKDFTEKAHEVLKDGFVDVMEGQGKRSGAYSSSQADSHPFILLNYSKTLDDVFTVAHEAGHSMHSMYAQETQPMNLQGYTIFVAEIASTFNEHLLLDYFMQSSNTSKEEKIMLLQKAIDEIVGTFYRQLLFAEYELIASKMVEVGQPLNHEVLSNIMIDLYKKYYGLNITKEKVKQYVWAYIPHLYYTPFYVYQYATSFAASLKLYKAVRDKEEGAFDRYVNLLKSGGSKFPVEQAKEAGVDLTTKDAFMAVVDRIDELVEELEKLLG